MSKFLELSKINVNEHVEKKNGLTYLSWAWAVDQLFRHDHDANWVFNEPVMFGETMMVSCTVTAFGKPITMHLPVMDHRNQAVKNPDAFAVNKNMMRCLVKAIACHAIGLYIYAGEDIPEGAKEPTKPHSPTDGAIENLPLDLQTAAKDDADSLVKMWEEDKQAAFNAYLSLLEGDSEYMLAVWAYLKPFSKVRSGLKLMKQEMK